MSDEIYNEGYRHGYEDAVALGECRLRTPHIVVWFDNSWHWEWRNVEFKKEALSLLGGLRDVFAALRDQAELK